MSTLMFIYKESLDAIADKIRECNDGLQQGAMLSIPSGFENGIEGCLKSGKDHMLKRNFSTYDANTESYMYSSGSYGKYAFAGNDQLTSVIINERIPLPDYCFLNCSNLETIEWSGTSEIARIYAGGLAKGTGCFEGCTSLTGIRLSGTPANDNRTIGARAFYGCESLEEVTLSNSPYNDYNSIGNEAFYGCTSLTYFPFGSYIDVIGDSAFENSGLTQANINQNYVSATRFNIGERAFANCEDLESVTISVSSAQTPRIGSYCFANDTSLTNVTLPNRIDRIPAHCFDGCTALETITIPASVNIIEEYAFNNCTSLRNVIFANNSVLTTIGARAFYNTVSLETFTVPSGVTSIGAYAFANLGTNPTAMRYLRLLPITPPSAGTYILDKTILNDSFVIYVPRSMGDTILSEYQNATNWKNPNYRNRMQEWTES